LRVIDALEANQSLLKAATVLGLGQPAVSRSLAEAETIIGQKLFERHPRGVRPTEAGMVLVRLARRILAEMRRADEALDRIGQVAAIGALPVAAVGVLPGALIRLKASHPDILLRVEQGRMEELLALLAAGEIDLVVGRLYTPATPDAFLREALWQEPLSIIARPGHPILARGGPQLAACELVLPTVSQRVGQEIDQLLARLGLGGAALRASSHGFIREMLLATDMVSIMPRSMMAGDLLRGALRVAALPLEAPPRPAGIITSPDRPLPPAALAFCQALRGHLAELAAEGIADMPIADTSTRNRHETSHAQPS